MSKHLPTQSNLRQLRNQAKDLAKDHRAGYATAARRIAANLPRLAGAPATTVLASDFSLQEAQHVIAKEYGFPTWKLLIVYAKTEPDNVGWYRSYLPEKEAAAMERAQQAVRTMAMEEFKTRKSVVEYRAGVDVGTDEWDLRVDKIMIVPTWETPEQKETTDTYTVMDFVTINDRQPITSNANSSESRIKGDHFKSLNNLHEEFCRRTSATLTHAVGIAVKIVMWAGAAQTDYAEVESEHKPSTQQAYRFTMQPSAVQTYPCVTRKIWDSRLLTSGYFTRDFCCNPSALLDFYLYVIQRKSWFHCCLN